MTPSRDEAFLRDMLDAARRIEVYLAGRERAALDVEPMLLDAVVRQFEILGEAARHVSPGGRALLPELPWRAMVGMRNQLIHAYKAVDPDAVWRTAREDLPPLVLAISARMGG